MCLGDKKNQKCIFHSRIHRTVLSTITENIVLLNTLHPVPTATLTCYEYILLLHGQSPTSHHKCLMFHMSRPTWPQSSLNIKNSTTNPVS